LDRPDAVAEARERIMAAWRDFDRAGTPEIAVTRATQVGTDTDRDPEKPLVGEADAVLEDLAAYADAGATRVVLDFYTRDVDEQLDQLERWSERVLPRLQDRSAGGGD
jgi:alkanesulfonate monooxygenase SsuD/methylene tetrahydromethanopterin reductase-like flavin-dependent oxidoreductase (luciferase family)